MEKSERTVSSEVDEGREISSRLTLGLIGDEDSLSAVKGLGDEPKTQMDSLIEGARAEGRNVSEVAVWGSETVVVPSGEIGLIATDGLNGCHLTVIVAKDNGARIMTMTHFPPEIGKKRYAEAIKKLKEMYDKSGVEPSIAISLIASDRMPSEEHEAIESLFPYLRHETVGYVSRDPKRKELVDSGRAVAVLDARDNDGVLHLFTENEQKTTSL